MDQSTESALPLSFSLSPNYPNPFNASTIIPFTVPAVTLGDRPHVDMAVYDLLGQKVRALVNEDLGPGVHRISWDGRDDHGRRLATGAYVYRLQAADHAQARKLLLIR